MLECRRLRAEIWGYWGRAGGAGEGGVVARGMMGCGDWWRGLEVAKGMWQMQSTGQKQRFRFCLWGGEVRSSGE